MNDRLKSYLSAVLTMAHTRTQNKT